MGTRDEAKASYSSKMDRMGLTGDGKGEKVRTAAMGEDVGIGHSGSASDGSMGTVKSGYATGYESAAANEGTMAKKNRLDRPAYKSGGRVKGTTVNIVIAGQPKPEAPPPMPMPPPMMPPPPPPMMGGPGGPPPDGPPLPGVPMGRKSGGRVPHMNAGAGGAKGRLEKKAAYGSKA